MSEETVEQPIAEVPQEVTPDTIELTEVIQTNGQTPIKAFHYKLTHPDQSVEFATVLAPSSNVAHDGLNQQFPQSTATYSGKSTIIMQCNG